MVKCDICGKGDAEEWILCVEDKKWRIDLCNEEHGALLRQWAEMGKVDPPVVAMNTNRYDRLVRGVPTPPDPPKG